MSESDDRKTLLLVDDAPANIQVANSILKDEYRVRVATSGAKALELVKVKPVPDLILLDVEMPEMDGYEVCRRLKADPETREIPVIFLTGKTEAEDETRGFSVGAVDYIHKPFSPAVVKARVQTHLALRETREQLARQLSAIQNELEMARKIQLSILPREVPRIEGARDRGAVRPDDGRRRRLLRLHSGGRQALRGPRGRRVRSRRARGARRLDAQDRARRPGAARRRSRRGCWPG